MPFSFITELLHYLNMLALIYPLAVVSPFHMYEDLS